MNSTRLVALLLLAATALHAEPWTLDRALAVALKDSPDARLAARRADVADAMVEQARAQWYPQFSLKGGYTWTNNPMMAFGSILGQRAFNFGLDFNHPGEIDNLNAAGTVAYNLYGGGSPTARLEAARSGRVAASEDVRAAENRLGATVVKAYLDIRKARDGVAAIEAGVKSYEAAVAVARARYDAGQMLKADLLSLEVQLAQTRETLSSARHGAALAGRAFAFVLGDDTNTLIELAEDDPSVGLLSAPAAADFSRHPDLLGLQARVRAATAMLQAARGGRQPSVNAFATYQYDHGWQLDHGADSWMAGVSVDLNVFDGGQTSGRIRQATAELAAAKEMLRKATLGIGLEVEQARLAHEDAQERLAVSVETVAQATESADLSQARFEGGEMLISDLIGVEGRLIEARMRHAFAVADERLAVADLRRALGLPILPSP